MEAVPRSVPVVRQSARPTRATRDDGRGTSRSAVLSGASSDPDWRVPLARWLAPLLLGIVAFSLVLEITESPNPGIDPDALAYVGSAESFARHGEFRVPTAHWPSRDSTSALLHFPPGFSTAIALPVQLGMQPVQGARLVEASAAFVTVTTLVLLVADVTAPLAGILLGVALFAMSAMHEVHLSVLSEPIFLAFLALTLAAMVRSNERPWLAGLWASLAAMTRYAGLSAIGAVALWSVARRGTLAERVRRCAWALLPAAVLQGLWYVRTKLVAPAEPIRDLALYGNLGASIKQGAATLASWLVPDADGALDPADAMPHRGAIAAVAGALLVVIVVAGALRARRQQRDDANVGNSSAGDALHLIAAAGLLLVCYVGLLVLSRLIADPGIPFDERILAPVIVLCTTIAATGLALWWRSTRAELPKIAVCGALLAWWLGAASVTWIDASYVMAWGSDFAADQWHRSELLEWGRAHGGGHPLYLQLAGRGVLLSAPAGARRAAIERELDSSASSPIRCARTMASCSRSTCLDGVRDRRFAGEDARGFAWLPASSDGAVFVAVPREATPARPPTAAPPSPRR